MLLGELIVISIGLSIGSTVSGSLSIDANSTSNSTSSPKAKAVPSRFILIVSSVKSISASSNPKVVVERSILTASIAGIELDTSLNTTPLKSALTKTAFSTEILLSVS